MLRVLVLISIIPWATCQKKFGHFYFEYEFLGHPFPENDVLHYRFRLSRVSKYEKQMTGWLKFFKKVTDLRIYIQLFKKTSAGYRSDSPTSPTSKSFCFESIPIFPVLQDSFSGKINKEDCSVEEGEYVLYPYDMEKELRRFAGNKTFYGDFIGRLVWLEGSNKILGVDIGYSVKDADLRFIPHHEFNRG